MSSSDSKLLNGTHQTDLQQYHVCYDTGFMLKDPLTALPPYFDAWNQLADSLPSLVKEKKVREIVDNMPLLDYTRLEGYRQKRLAHLQLCFITAGYVWQDGDIGVSKVLPKSIAVPFYKISEELGIKPVLGHVDLALANWGLKDPNGPYEFENLKCLYHLPGEWSGDWFCIVTFMLEFNFAKSLKHIVRLLDLVHKGRPLIGTGSSTLKSVEEEIVECLKEVINGIKAMQSALSRMHDHLEAKTFFNVLRPFLGGWGGDNNPLPDGLIYEGISDTPVQMPGGSAAQSATLQIVDGLLGVQHSADKKDFLLHMRNFMPPDHKRFIEDLENRPYQLRDFVQSSNNPAVESTYNACLSALVEFRNYHIQIVTKYVVIASREVNEGKYGSLDAKGTGGTSLIPFLKVIRVDTEDKMLKSQTKKEADARTITAKSPSFSTPVAGFLLAAGAPVAVGLAYKYFFNS